MFWRLISLIWPELIPEISKFINLLISPFNLQIMVHLGSDTSPGAVSQVQKSLAVSHSSGDSNGLNFGMQERLQLLSNIIIKLIIC